MALKEELKELFDLLNNHIEDVAFLNFTIKMKNGTIFKYKMDKKIDFMLKLKEEIEKWEQNKKNN